MIEVNWRLVGGPNCPGREKFRSYLWTILNILNNGCIPTYVSCSHIYLFVESILEQHQIPQHRIGCTLKQSTCRCYKDLMNQRTECLVRQIQ